GAAHRAAVGLADDRYDRHVIEFGVVEPVEQMYRARPRGRHAHSEPIGELRIPHGLESAHLLVPSLDEPRRVTGATECGDDAVDAVAGIGEHVLDVPLA